MNGNLNLSRAIGDLEYKKRSDLPPQEQVICSTPDVVVRVARFEAQISAPELLRSSRRRMSSSSWPARGPRSSHESFLGRLRRRNMGRDVEPGSEKSFLGGV